MDEFQKYLMGEYDILKTPQQPQPQPQQQPQQQEHFQQQPQIIIQQPQPQSQQQKIQNTKKKIKWFKPTICAIGFVLIIIVIVICATLSGILKKIEMQMVCQQITSQFKNNKLMYQYY